MSETATRPPFTLADLLADMGANPKTYTYWIGRILVQSLGPALAAWGLTASEQSKFITTTSALAVGFIIWGVPTLMGLFERWKANRYRDIAKGEPTPLAGGTPSRVVY